MNLADIVTAPWAILPDTLTEIVGIYQAHVSGQAIDLKAVEARIGRPVVNERQGYTIINGTAVIPVHGVIAPRMNLMTQISGGVSAELLARDFKAALADKDVNQIILDIDSPGGTVTGTAEVAQLVYASRGRKPITAFANGLMASAAYWIGSAADSVFASAGTTQVGSIGVVATHVDYSEMDKRAGIRRTEIYAGKYKRIASENRPLTKDGKATIQAEVDYLYSIFIGEVARHRGISVDDALAMADGKIFIGRQAVDIGLIDGITTMDALLKGQSTTTTPAKEVTTTMSTTTDSETFERQVKQEWQRSADVRADFAEFEDYLAYRQAEASGHVKIVGGSVRARGHV